MVILWALVRTSSPVHSSLRWLPWLRVSTVMVTVPVRPAEYVAALAAGAATSNAEAAPIRRGRFGSRLNLITVLAVVEYAR